MTKGKLDIETIPFCPAQELFLKPLSILRIVVVLPKMTIPGQSISNWDLMERIKKAVAPIEMDSIKVTDSNMESVIFEAELLSSGIMGKAATILNELKMKVSGFSEALKVNAKEAHLDFPTRHDWDVWFGRNKMNENMPGERPDTIYLSKIPIKWFHDKKEDKPSEKMLHEAFSTFGTIRSIDIPICDPYRKEINQKYSGFQMKSFNMGQDIYFEAYIQYSEYKGFATAMDVLRNKKWSKKIDGKLFHTHVKVDFDKTRHLSDPMVKKRNEEIERIKAKKLREIEMEKEKKRAEELKIKLEKEQKEKRREERERKRREKRELERLAEEERKRKAEELAKREELIKKQRTLESKRLLQYLFQKIEEREKRRKEREEEELKEELCKMRELDEEGQREHVLRQALLKSQEMRMRAKLEEKLRDKKQRRRRHRSESSSSSSESLDDRRNRKKHRRRRS